MDKEELKKLTYIYSLVREIYYGNEKKFDREQTYLTKEQLEEVLELLPKEYNYGPNYHDLVDNRLGIYLCLLNSLKHSERISMKVKFVIAEHICEYQLYPGKYRNNDKALDYRFNTCSLLKTMFDLIENEPEKYANYREWEVNINQCRVSNSLVNSPEFKDLKKKVYDRFDGKLTKSSHKK